MAVDNEKKSKASLVLPLATCLQLQALFAFVDCVDASPIKHRRLSVLNKAISIAQRPWDRLQALCSGADPHCLHQFVQ